MLYIIKEEKQLQLISELIKEIIQIRLRVLQSIIILMSKLSQIGGIDVSEYEVVELSKKAFGKVDYETYTPLRMHFLVHAVQFQHRLPSEATMVRCERRNMRKSGEEQANARVGRSGRAPRMIHNPKNRRRFVLPKKHGAPYHKRVRRGRRNQRSNVNLPNNARLPLSNMFFPPISSGNPPSSLPGVQSTPPIIILGYLPGTRPPSSLPLNPPSTLPNPTNTVPPSPSTIPGMMPFPFSAVIPPSMGSMNPMMIPPGLFPPGLGMPPMSMPPMPFGMPVGKSMTIPPCRPVPLSSSLPVGLPQAPSTTIKRKRNKSPKPKPTAFKIKSPEQIVLKNARNVCRQNAQKWRSENPVVITSEVKKQIPIYFQKKKANQKRRRQEKHELIKKNRKRLTEIYGDSVFQSGWPISRKEIKQALGIKDETAQQSFEGISELMQQGEKEQKVEQVQQTQVEQTKPEEAVIHIPQEQKIKLVLHKEYDEAQSQTTLQYALTG